MENLIEPFLFKDIEGMPPMISEGKCLAAMKEWETLTNKSRDEEIAKLKLHLEGMYANNKEGWGKVEKYEQEIERLKGLIDDAYVAGAACSNNIIHTNIPDYVPNPKGVSLTKFKTKHNLTQ